MLVDEDRAKHHERLPSLHTPIKKAKTSSFFFKPLTKAKGPNEKDQVRPTTSPGSVRGEPPPLGKLLIEAQVQK